MESTARKPGRAPAGPTRLRAVFVPARPYLVAGRPTPSPSDGARPGSGSVRSVASDQSRPTGPVSLGRHLPPPPPPGPIARVATAAVSSVAVRGDPLPVGGLPRPALPLPHLRRNVCPHFYMTGARGAIPVQAPHLLKALMRQDSTVSRCQLRGGVHLDPGYVSDICLSSRFNQCVFYEDELTRR